MKNKRFSVGGMSCASCSAHVEKAVRAIKGVDDVTVSLLDNSMRVIFDFPANEQSICDAVKKAGYSATAGENVLPGNNKSNGTGRRLLFSALLLVLLMMLSMGYTMWGMPLPVFLTANPTAIAFVQLLLAAVIMVLNRHFFTGGLKSLFHGAPNMDTLVAIGSGAAFLYSSVVFAGMCVQNGTGDDLHNLYFESAAMIVTLVTVGKLLEEKSKKKTTDAVRGLAALAPKTATLLVDGKETVIPAEKIKKNDCFLVRPGESIAADAVVTEGESAVDESALTGESIPVDKSAGNSVSAATVNGYGTLVCRAVRVGEDTALSRIVELVKNAAATKAPIAKVADRVAGIFVPVVLVLAAITFIVWMLISGQVGYSLARAISVLVISCPCALGLATPVAVVVGNGVGAKHGILFGTAAALEETGRVRFAVFDKTGTLTNGTPAVTDILPNDKQGEELLAIASALEQKSEHPLAKAIRDYAEKAGYSAIKVAKFRALPGHGVEAEIDGKHCIGGNAGLMQANDISLDRLSDAAKKFSFEGKTPLFFAREKQLLGIIAVADTPKKDSAVALNEIRRLGIRTVMLTGDNRRTALAVAKSIGTDAIIADVLPDEKAGIIRRLREYGKVCMVGDGINDAPALTVADVGIALGTGTDIAVSAADVVLMRPFVRDVTLAVQLSRSTLTNIRENLFWAFIYNCIGIPIAAGVFVPLGLTLSPMIGAAAMSLSSVCVVLNALRLNRFRPNMNRKSGKVAPEIPAFLIDNNRETEEKLMKIKISIEGMMCEHCVAHVKEALLQTEGVSNAEVSLKDKTATVTVPGETDNSALFSAVKAAGYIPIAVETVTE